MKTLKKSLIAASIAIVFSNSYADNSLVGKPYDLDHFTNHAVKLKDGKVVQDFQVAKNTGIIPVPNIEKPLYSKEELTTLKIPESYNGQEAIDFLGSKINIVAEKHNVEPAYLKEQLLIDPTVIVTKDGQLAVVEPKLPTAAIDAIKSAPTAGTTQATPSDVFALHSKPNSTKKVYLKFNGYTTVNDNWGTGTAAPYSTDSDPTTFNDSERDQIYKIWAITSEDYAPFDVDVTTEEPTPDQIVRTSMDDQEYGMVTVITSSAPGVISQIGNNNIGGISYVGIYNFVNYDYINSPTTYSPYKARINWVFGTTGLLNGTKYIAEAVSHEDGHAFGLLHHGYISNNINYSYYPGHGFGETGWAPIMGVGYYKNVTQWSNGSYPTASNPSQADLTVINSKLDYKPDDVSDATDASYTLAEQSTVNRVTTLVPYSGLITKNSDVDMFNFTVPSEKIVTFSATNWVRPDFLSAGNLDIKMSILDANGAEVIVSDDQTTINATISTKLPAGLYYVKIQSGFHNSDGVVDYGYSTYGSIGQYTLAGQLETEFVPTPVPSATPLPTATPVPVAPNAVIDAPEKSGTVPVTVHFSANNSIVGTGTITDYFWDFGDGATDTNSNPVHTYIQSGTFTTSLVVTNSAGLTSTANTITKVAATTGPSVKIKAMTVGLKTVKTPTYNMTSTVTIINQLKKPVLGAKVYGKFSGVYRQEKKSTPIQIETNYPTEFTATTDKSGKAVIVANPSIYVKGGTTLAFTVTKVVPPSDTMYYNASQNAITTKVYVKK
jgi:PKD repeat protein